MNGGVSQTTTTHTPTVSESQYRERGRKVAIVMAVICFALALVVSGALITAIVIMGREWDE